MLLLGLMTLAGLALLVFCADHLVDQCSELAERYGISPTIIGLTVVAFGTSLPELVFTSGAAYRGSGGLAAGNIVGSNIANTLLILGVAAAFCPLPIQRRVFLRDGTVWGLSTVIFVIFSYANPEFGLFVGTLFICILCGYLWVLYRDGQLDTDPDAGISTDSDGSMRRPAMIVVLSLAGIAFGSELALNGALGLSAAFGVAESFVGLTVIAIGTSLPELATALACVKRRQPDMLVGNIIGSNIFNILACIGIPAAIFGITLPQEMLGADFLILLGVTGLAMILLRTNWKLGNVEGLACLALYCVYLSHMVGTV